MSEATVYTHTHGPTAWITIELKATGPNEYGFISAKTTQAGRGIDQVQLSDTVKPDLRDCGRFWADACLLQRYSWFCCVFEVPSTPSAVETLRSINQKLTTFFIIFKWCRTKHRWVVYSVVSALHGRTMTNKHRPLHLRCENITIIRPSCSWTQYVPIPFWTEASVWLAFTSPSSYTSTRIGTLYLDTSVLIKHRGEMGFTCCQK